MIAEWLRVNPTSGSGDASVNVTANTENSGRNARETNLQITAANVPPVSVRVLQRGKPEYADVQDTATAERTGQIINISGISNSAKLTWSLGSGNLDVVLPETYMAASVSTANGAAIDGDPGATAEYSFNIVITVPANEAFEEKTRQIIVEDENGNRDICTLRQSANEPTLSVDLSIVELEYTGGSSATIRVTSNTSWTVS